MFLPWQLQNPRTSHEGCRENHRSHGGFSSWLPEAIYLPVGIISSATFGRGKTHTFGKQLYSGFGGSSLGNTHFDTPTSATCWFHSTLLSYPFYRVFLLDDFSPGLFGQYPHRSWNPMFPCKIPIVLCSNARLVYISLLILVKAHFCWLNPKFSWWT